MSINNIESLFKIWTTSRKIYVDYLNKYSLEQLNKVPPGFNNNLIWNIGHVVAAQQSLVYKLSSTPMHISDEFFDRYKSGTKPETPATQADADELKHLLTDLIQKTKTDWNNCIFTTFTERLTGTGFHLTTIQDALEFNNYHEGLHLGVMMSIRKLV